MPCRIIRDGILRSQRVNTLSRDAELFYRRLMSVVDDYGRYEADPAILRSDVFPLKVDEISEEQILAWLKECSTGEDPLIVVYRVKRHKYLQILNFGQRERREKYPAPPPRLAANGGGPPPTAAVGGSRDGCEYSLSPPPPNSQEEGCGEKPNGAPANDSGGFGLREHFDELVQTYPPEGRERLEQAFTVFTAKIAEEARSRKVTQQRIFRAMVEGIVRWKTSERWQSGRVHLLKNFLGEGLWREHPVSGNGKPPPTRRKSAPGDYLRERLADLEREENSRQEASR